MLGTIYVPKIQLQTPRHEEDEKSVKRTKDAHRKMETLAEKARKGYRSFMSPARNQRVSGCYG